MGWFGKKQQPEPVHVETDAEYWARMDAIREAREIEAKRLAEIDDDVYVDRSELKPTREELEDGLFNYELSAYSDKVGYYSDGIEMVCPIRR